MKVQWNKELDIETLKSKGRWATLKEYITASYPIPSQSLQTYSRKVQSEWTFCYTI